jgi:hypothetical protein
MRWVSRFFNMSNWVRKPRMASLGESFFFAAPPPNQPQTPDMALELRETIEKVNSKDRQLPIEAVKLLSGWLCERFDRDGDDDGKDDGVGGVLIDGRQLRA